MARICEITGKTAIKGNSVSHSNKKTKRTFSPNIQTKTFWVAEEDRKADPTGVGDAFRAGFLAGQTWGLSDERSAQLGALLATYVIETVGTQEYELAQRHVLDRLARTYGDDAASDVEPHLSCPRP